MKKITYLNQEVTVGRVINHCGIKTIVTEDLIKLNPDLFKVEWAEIIKSIFTTEDGVDIYKGMKTYKIFNLGVNVLDVTPRNYDGIDTDAKYFFHKKNALAYIEKSQKKDLEYYENRLFENRPTSGVITSSGSIYFNIWGWFKNNEPKVFYSKILQVIADDLNDGWVADFNDPITFKYHINKCGDEFNISSSRSVETPSTTYFKSRELAGKVIDILGDKIEYIFNVV